MAAWTCTTLMVPTNPVAPSTFAPVPILPYEAQLAPMPAQTTITSLRSCGSGHRIGIIRLQGEREYPKLANVCPAQSWTTVAHCDVAGAVVVAAACEDVVDVDRLVVEVDVTDVVLDRLVVLDLELDVDVDMDVDVDVANEVVGTLVVVVVVVVVPPCAVEVDTMVEEREEVLVEDVEIDVEVDIDEEDSVLVLDVIVLDTDSELKLEVEDCNVDAVEDDGTLLDSVVVLNDAVVVVMEVCCPGMLVEKLAEVDMELNGGLRDVNSDGETEAWDEPGCMLAEDVDEALVRMPKDVESDESVGDLDVDMKVEEVVAPDMDMLEERPDRVVDKAPLDVHDDIDVLGETTDATLVIASDDTLVDAEVLDAAVVGASVGEETLEL